MCLSDFRLEDEANKMLVDVLAQSANANVNYPSADS